MAALCPGVQYGLSSHQNFGENKELIFVKLTDSALRAIEEYIKNQNKFSCPSPTIKFIGNENGELSFPRGGGEQRPTSFSFSVSSTADMGGPGGSFECVRQGGPPSGALDALGAIPYKMRVHANEDVYEATRHRMTEAEDKYKNKCTREIKPNQTDIGRKVKVKQGARPPIPPPPPRQQQQQQSPQAPQPSMRDSLLKSSATVAPLQKAMGQQQAPPPVHSSSNGLSNGLGSNHVSSSRPQQQQQQKRPSVPDVTRRPLRERLIHLLALRPFKKVELHDRLMKEGVREKKSMMSVLNAISHCKDNCFHLNGSMWDEVNEDWPFYTETERQILRRRKPQNRTSPGGGSDGGSSTGSGQSPTSTHPGSPPPPPAKRPPLALAAAHNGAGPPPADGGPPYKRPRIAHGHHRPADPPYRQPAENNNPQRRPPTDLRDASNMNPRSRETPSPLNGHHPSPQAAAAPPPPHRSPDEHPAAVAFWGLNVEPLERRKPSSGGGGGGGGGRVTSSTTPPVARVSPDSQTEGLPEGGAADGGTPNGRGEDKGADDGDDDEEFPDYHKLYVPINNSDQRRRYKSDFNADYAEYKYLHGIVEKVSRRFVLLEEMLKQQDKNSPTYKDIRKQIVREYHENKRDTKQQRAKRRFQYLHDKLSHIKGLVAEYDKAGACGAY